MSQLTINGRTSRVRVDPEAKSLISMDHRGSGSDHILIKTKSALKRVEKDELVEAGARDLEYVGNDTYLCHFRPDDISVLQAKSYVVGVSIYESQFKVSDRLSESLNAYVRQEEQLTEVTLMLHSARTDQEIDKVVNKVAEVAGVSSDDIEVDEDAHTLWLEVSPSKIQELAHLDAIKVIHEVAPKVLYNDCARQILGFPSDGSTEAQHFQWQGEGQVIAIADTGLDNGDINNIHPAFRGRIKELVSINRSVNKRTDDPNGHGTHVCGSALGAAVPTAAIYKHVQGTAPKASLVMQSLYSSSDPIKVPRGSKLLQMFLDPYQRYGACVHSNSWGDPPSSTQTAYDDPQCKAVDNLIREHPDLLIIMAAGNDGDQADTATIRSLAACKNVLTVGATDSFRPSINGEFSKTKLSENDPTEISWFSSRGPTMEQRIKPDVLAPGTPILSTKSSIAPAENGQASDDPQYCFMRGTSMATPLIAGCAAVVREYLIKSGIAKPPAALLKALLINGAYALHHAHNGKEGFGIVNIANSLISNDDKGGYRIGKTFTDIGQDESLTILVPGTATKPTAQSAIQPRYSGSVNALRVSPPSRKGFTLKVTMAYTDVGGAELQNNLNLQVIAADGSARNGNRGSSSNDDNNNNVEQVIWKGITPGNATIKVKCERLTSKDNMQDYALVWKLIPNED